MRNTDEEKANVGCYMYMYLRYHGTSLYRTGT